MTECPVCHGYGEVCQTSQFTQWYEFCPECDGSGETSRDVCSDCRGSGYLPVVWTFHSKTESSETKAGYLPKCARCNGSGFLS